MIDKRNRCTDAPDLLSEAIHHVEAVLHARSTRQRYQLPKQLDRWWKQSEACSAREAMLAANAHLGILQVCVWIWGQRTDKLGPDELSWWRWRRPSRN